MVYVKRFFIILLIIMLLTYNIGFCADTMVNFSSISNNFYVAFSTLASNQNLIIQAINNYSIYAERLFKYNFNFDLPIQFILTEQDNLQDEFIKVLQNNEGLRNLFRDRLDVNVYGLIYQGQPNLVYFQIYYDNEDKQTYQSNPIYGFSENFNASLNNGSGVNRLYYFRTPTSQINSKGRALFVKDTNEIYVNMSYTATQTIPTCALDYKSENLRNYLNNLRGVNPTTQAIQENTQAINNSTDRILSQDTDPITDTGVTDSSTDSSPDLQGTFNSMSSAFTTRNTSTKTFAFVLPNGQSYNFVLNNNLLTNMLRSYGSVFYAFYQAMFWVVFGGYVLFDFKRIINKFKGGDIDSVVSTSSPIDNVVKASLG